MSTRGIYTFKGVGQAFHVFVHYDNYPSGAADYFRKTLTSNKVFALPRYEPDEFASGFIATIKEVSGNVRLSPTRRSYSDVEYGYTVEPDKTDPQLLRLTACRTNYWGIKTKETRLWTGSLIDFVLGAADKLGRGDD